MIHVTRVMIGLLVFAVLIGGMLLLHYLAIASGIDWREVSAWLFISVVGGGISYVVGAIVWDLGLAKVIKERFSGR